MTNFQVYKKILSFSLVNFLVDILSLAQFIGFCTLGFIIGMKASSDGAIALLGLGIGFILGIVVSVLINIFLKNRIKAAQIAIMVKGVTEGNLPEHAFKEGFNEIKGRFGRITAFFFITNAIKGIFNQLGRTINKIGTALGGQTGNTITSVIDSAVQTLIGYLCDCCLGWILYRKDENAAKAGCEGAVIFFKHGKTLIKNIGRIFGMGALSFVVIAGAFTGVGYLVLSQFPQAVQAISDAIIATGENVPEFVYSINTLALVVSFIGGVIVWSMLHSMLVRPFILVGVMRNFMAAGIADIPSEKDFAMLDSKSSKFRKLHANAQ